MAYICYIACDKCGDTLTYSINETMGITFSRRYAREKGWQVGSKGWFCPTCRRKIKKER